HASDQRTSSPYQIAAGRPIFTLLVPSIIHPFLAAISPSHLLCPSVSLFLSHSLLHFTPSSTDLFSHLSHSDSGIIMYSEEEHTHTHTKLARPRVQSTANVPE